MVKAMDCDSIYTGSIPVSQPIPESHTWTLRPTEDR